MKKYMKWVALILVLAMMTMTLFGCSSEQANKDTVYSNAEDLLDTVWGKSEEEGIEIPIVGGAGDSYTDGEPGAFDMEQKDILASSYSVPAAITDSAISGAGFMNAMMANYLTVSAWQFKDVSSVDECAKEAAEYLEEMEWLCAMPENYAIYSTDDFLVIIYGISDQTEPVEKACQSLFGEDSLLESGGFTE